jgi:REP element-mobilizing transposase RayT
LCGRDPVNGYDFEHRRQWIVDRIQLLSSVFAIDLCAYAVMSNHYHVVVRINSAAVDDWSDEEVAQRWTQLFSRPALIHRYLGQSDMTQYEQKQVTDLISTWRGRLQDLSWFMRCLNEPIARLANHEDNCTGRFWEGRFKSQALLDDRALLACMAYVDLNPIRAAMAKTPESSDFTSIQQRLQKPDSSRLMGLSGQGEEPEMPFSINEYLELLDWAGREVKRGKKGFIPPTTPPILTRLNMHSSPVLNYLKRHEPQMPVAMGSVPRLRCFAQSVGRRFIKGLTLGKSLCPESG